MKNLIMIFSLLFSMTAFATNLPSKKISLEVKQAGVREVLEGMLTSSGLKYEMAPSITNESKVSIEAKQIEWSQVFKNIIEQSKLKYSFDKTGKLHITKM